MKKGFEKPELQVQVICTEDLMAPSAGDQGTPWI